MRYVLALAFLVPIILLGVAFEAAGHTLARWFGGHPLVWSAGLCFPVMVFCGYAATRAYFAMRRAKYECQKHE